MNIQTDRQPVPLALLKTVFTSPNVPALFDGKRTHEPALKFVNELLPHTQDEEWIVEIARAALPKKYNGNTLSEIPEMVRSGITKGIHRVGRELHYDPGNVGPVPLGYTKEGSYALRDQIRKIVIIASANQLLSFQYLLGLAESSFWAAQFPAEKRFNFLAVGETLIALCKQAGPFNPLRVRGRGVWKEGERIILNFGGPVPDNVNNLYLCFEPIDLIGNSPIDAQRLLDFLELFSWRNPQDAMLLLGWLALAPICGVLEWRPHCFVYGPARSGKTTIHRVAAHILRPLVISADGQSSEAGIRQLLGPDSLPVVIDEFESDQNNWHIKRIVRLARSASSADNPVLRGTPEGKAMQFSLRTTFFFSAISPTGLSPADESRILLMELKMHESDPDIATRILEAEIELRELGPNWCASMISLAPCVGPSIKIFEKAIPGQDRRHLQNMATLLAGAFVALKGRIPNKNEASEWAKKFAQAIKFHEESLDRDDAGECLAYLYAHVVDDETLGDRIAYEVSRGGDNSGVLRRFDIVIRKEGPDPGIFFRNNSSALDKVFQGTKWKEGGWMRTLGQLPGAFKPKNPIYFPNIARKSRCIGIPLDRIPDLQPPEDY